MEKNNPEHVGIILDGNRRFAKRLMQEPWKGHEMGAAKLEKLFLWSKELGIRELTLYCFSLENFNRPKREFDFLMKIFKKEFKRLKNDKRLDKDKIKIQFVGKTDIFDDELKELIKEIETKTKNHENYKINFALGYGGKQEIIEAVKKMVEKGEEITEKNLGNNLWIKNEPDMIIRTGGEMRTSNFLPWQSTYSEWFFLKKMWPEFNKKDLVFCLEEFKTRQRRFGK